MDQAALVRQGHALVDLMDAEHIAPAFVMWVYSEDAGIWRLWVVPPTSLQDIHAFYRRISKLLTDHKSAAFGLEASDVELVKGDHPAVASVSRALPIQGKSVVRLSNNWVDGFFIPDGILLRTREPVLPDRQPSRA